MQVAFIEWTVHGKLRHPRLLGVRFDKDPRDVTREKLSSLGWSEQRLHHIKSYCGMFVGGGEEAREQALALYEGVMWRGPAQVRLHRATSMIASGDVREGARHAAAVLAPLSAAQRSDRFIRRLAVGTLAAVPEKARSVFAIDSVRPGFDVAACVPVLLTDDVAAGREALKQYYALYVGGMGARGRNFYNDLFMRYGYEGEARVVQVAGPRLRLESWEPDPQALLRVSSTLASPLQGGATRATAALLWQALNAGPERVFVRRGSLGRAGSRTRRAPRAFSSCWERLARLFGDRETVQFHTRNFLWSSI